MTKNRVHTLAEQRVDQAYFRVRQTNEEHSSLFDLDSDVRLLRHDSIQIAQDSEFSPLQAK